MVKPHIFNFFADVNDQTIGTLISQISEAIRACDENRADSIVIKLSSMGGKLHSCFTFYQFIRSIRTLVPITMLNLANVESAGLMMYLAGDTRLMVPYSKFAVHEFSKTWSESAAYSQMKMQIASFDSDIKRFADVYHERTGGDISTVLHGGSLIFDESMALKEGIAQAVVDPESLEAHDAVRWWVTA